MLAIGPHGMVLAPEKTRRSAPFGEAIKEGYLTLLGASKERPKRRCEVHFIRDKASGDARRPVARQGTCEPQPGRPPQAAVESASICSNARRR